MSWRIQLGELRCDSEAGGPLDANWVTRFGRTTGVGDQR